MLRVVAILAMMAAAAACGVQESQTPTSEPVGLPNPAAVNCINTGGSLQTRDATDGSQTTYCVFPDGLECEQWAMFRGECEGRQDWKSVSDTLDKADGSEVVLRGMYFLEIGDEPRICGVLRESFPPQCGGGSIKLAGYDLRSIPGVASEGDITWTDAPVVFAGTISGGTLTVTK